MKFKVGSFGQGIWLGSAVGWCVIGVITELWEPLLVGVCCLLMYYVWPKDL